MTKFAALHQEIQVNFRYGVYFTQDVFARHNPLLSEIVARRERGFAPEDSGGRGSRPLSASS